MKSISDVVRMLINGTTRHNRDWMMQKLRACEGRFLELGPGTAPLLSRLPEDDNYEKWVIEFPGVIEHCRRLGYHCLEQNLGEEKWEIEDESMDVVVSCQVLEHIPDTDHVMSECFRVLKPRGKLLVSTPNQGSLFNIVLLLLTVNPPLNMVSDRYYGLGNPFSAPRRSTTAGTGERGHLRLFATRAMKDLLKIYGFRVLAVNGGSWGLPLVGKQLARVFPYYGMFTTVLAQK